MATHMESWVTVKNGNKEVAQKLKEILQPDNGKYSCNTIELVNRLHGTSFSWDENLSREENQEAENTWPDWDWMQDNVGSKWITSEFHYDDNPENCHIQFTTAYSVPQPFLDKLAKELAKIKEDCYIIGTYEDEAPEVVGAFIYAGDYDDIEDDDSIEVVEILEMQSEENEVEDVDFNGDVIQFADGYDWFSGSPNGREKMHNMVTELRDSLEEAYFEYLEDKKNNPQDYE